MSKDTYTRKQVTERLGFVSRSAFHYLRRRCPEWFVVVEQGKDRTHPTRYDARKIDQFINARKLLKK